MCLACEQDAIWLAYLESQGLLKPDDPAAVEALFARVSGAAAAGQARMGRATPEAPAEIAAPKPACRNGHQNPFSCDDPTAE